MARHSLRTTRPKAPSSTCAITTSPASIPRRLHDLESSEFFFAKRKEVTVEERKTQRSHSGRTYIPGRDRKGHRDAVLQDVCVLLHQKLPPGFAQNRRLQCGRTGRSSERRIFPREPHSLSAVGFAS